MENQTAYVVPGNRTFFPVSIDSAICIGCNCCVEVCQVDVFAPNPARGMAPLILFPQECWQEGSCVEVCPQPEAITWKRLPIHHVGCRRKTTGEDFFV
jgi:NAD-dependent dihydropyrimidine dehydrogenase PreA subunit